MRTYTVLDMVGLGTLSPSTVVRLLEAAKVAPVGRRGKARLYDQQVAFGMALASHMAGLGVQKSVLTKVVRFASRADLPARIGRGQRWLVTSDVGSDLHLATEESQFQVKEPGARVGMVVVDLKAAWATFLAATEIEEEVEEVACV